MTLLQLLANKNSADNESTLKLAVSWNIPSAGVQNILGADDRESELAKRRDLVQFCRTFVDA